MEVHFEEPNPADSGSHELDPEVALSIPLDAPALETIEGQDGKPEDVIARVRTISEHGDSYHDSQPSAELVVVRRANNQLHFKAVDRFKHTMQEVSPVWRYRKKPTVIKTDTGAPAVEVRLTRPARKKDAPTLHISNNLYRGSRLRVTTAPEAATEEQTVAAIHNTTVQHNNQRRKRRIRRWLAGLALVHAANTSGGIIDAVGDTFSDAGTVVEQDFSAYQQYGSPEQKQAVRDVARTMQDLDDHNYDAILTRAQAFKEQHKDQFMPETKIEGLQSRINTAKSHSEIIKAVDDFMHFYGKAASVESTTTEGIKPFDPANVSLDNFRSQALGILDAYSFLPKKYVEDSYFNELLFSGPLQDEDTASSAHYDPNVDAIRFVATDKALGKVSDARGWTEEVAQHETAHASDPALQPFEHSKGSDISDGTGYALRWMIEAPEDVSVYAAANRGKHNEPYAESAVGVLSSEGNDLAHPDNTRRFNSEANKQFLTYLVELDEKYPGIADYVVAHSGVAQRGGPWPVVLTTNRLLSGLSR